MLILKKIIFLANVVVFVTSNERTNERRDATRLDATYSNVSVSASAMLNFYTVIRKDKILVVPYRARIKVKTVNGEMSLSSPVLF